MIESKMRSEIEHWKSAASGLQTENTLLQKESLKMSRDLMERTKQIKEKNELI
jgi:hypothetical protein